jgi:hypothetical protein
MEATAVRPGRSAYDVALKPGVCEVSHSRPRNGRMTRKELRERAEEHRNRSHSRQARALSSRPGLRVGNFQNAGYNLIDLLDLAIGECEPLNTANAIGLSGRFEHAALPQ